MALLDSRQLNPRLTGSFTLSGSLATDSASTGSFGRLDVSGDSSLLGNLTIGGNIQIGDSTGDSITITADLTSNLIPNTDNTYDLGTSTKNWRYGYIEQVIGDSVTTSGNVSGSATSTGSFGQLIIGNGGDIELIQDQRIYFEADKGTYIETDTTDRLRFVVGSNQMLLLDEDEDRVNIGYGNKLGVGLGNHTTPGEMLEVVGNISGSGTGSFSSLVVADKVQGDLTIGDSLTSNKGATFNAAQSSAHDFRALSVNKNYMLYVDANKDKVGIGFQNPEGKHLSSSLHIAGDLTTDSHITASGNFSGSLISTGSFGTLETSGVVNATGRIFENGTSVIDHATAMAIVFGG